MLLQLPTQATGQGCVLHAWYCTVPFAVAHAVPLYSGSRVIVYVEYCQPPAQVALQVLQGLQDAMQPTATGGHTPASIVYNRATTVGDASLTIFSPTCHVKGVFALSFLHFSV